jgi:CcmD family protein
MRPDETVALISIVAAYSIVFVGIFAFAWLTMSRQKKLEKKLEQLRDDLRDSTRKR